MPGDRPRSAMLRNGFRMVDTRAISDDPQRLDCSAAHDGRHWAIAAVA